MSGITPEPIYIGEHALVAKFFIMARNAGDPRRIEGTFTIVGDDATLTLDAIVGPQGNPGQPSPIIRPQWGSTVTDPADLPDLNTLDATDRGRAWYIAGFWHVYDEDDDGDNGAYHIVQGSIAGPPGATPNVTISAETIAAPDPIAYGPIEVTPTGTTLNKNYHFKIPAIPGPEGPSAAIENASDYDDGGDEAEVGQLLGKTGADTWGPVSPILRPCLKYSIPHALWIDYNGSAGRMLIGKLDLDVLDVDRTIDVDGHVRIKRSFVSTAQVEIEVRVGLTGDGTGEAAGLCGLAPYDPVWALIDAESVANILPHWSDPGNPMRAIAPDSDTGRLLAGNNYTVYVFGHKTGGAGTWQFTKAQAAQLNIRLDAAPELG